MKKITLIALLLSFLGNAQFFEQDHNPPEEEQSQDYGFHQDNSGYDEPDQGVDGPGNPGAGVPIDDAWPILVLGGIGIGFYFLMAASKKKTA